MINLRYAVPNLRVTSRSMPLNQLVSHPPLPFNAVRRSVATALGNNLEARKNGSSEDDKIRQLLQETRPQPVRHEFVSEHALHSKQLESFDSGVGLHRVPECFSDRVALAAVKSLRFPADLFFKKKYLYRAVMLETVAAVPGMVAGMMRHLRSLRKCKHDGGWINHLLHEAENERMHLMTWMKIIEPNFAERMLVTAVQGIFLNLYLVAYILFPKVCHRFVGYLEEEAVISYTHFLQEIDRGNIPNTPAPKIAIDYWNLEPTATLRDVVLAVRLDEAAHRDVNHHLSDRLRLNKEDLREPVVGTSTTAGKTEKTSWSALERKDIKV